MTDEKRIRGTIVELENDGFVRIPQGTPPAELTEGDVRDLSRTYGLDDQAALAAPLYEFDEIRKVWVCL